MHTRALIYGTAAAVAAASTRCSLLEGLAPQPLSQNEGFSGRFAAWEQRLSNLSGNLGDKIDIEVDGGTRFAESRKDKQFIWQTLREGDRRIKKVAMWRKPGESELVGKSRVEVIPDEIKGISQITLLVELGDELNGHPVRPVACRLAGSALLLECCSNIADSSSPSHPLFGRASFTADSQQRFWTTCLVGRP